MLLPDGRILMSGGGTLDEKCIPSYHKDLRQLDTETMLWSKAKTTGATCQLFRIVNVGLTITFATLLLHREICTHMGV